MDGLDASRNRRGASIATAGSPRLPLLRGTAATVTASPRNTENFPVAKNSCTHINGMTQIRRDSAIPGRPKKPGKTRNACECGSWTSGVGRSSFLWIGSGTSHGEPGTEAFVGGCSVYDGAYELREDSGPSGRPSGDHHGRCADVGFAMFSLTCPSLSPAMPAGPGADADSGGAVLCVADIPDETGCVAGDRTTGIAVTG